VTFREKIITLRNRLGINQQKMGTLLGVSRNYVSMMESEGSPREPSKAVKLLLAQLWEQEMAETPIQSEYSPGGA
jgi:transcriptional regulator with XRE-family HTH domain